MSLLRRLQALLWQRRQLPDLSWTERCALHAVLSGHDQPVGDTRVKALPTAEAEQRATEALTGLCHQRPELRRVVAAAPSDLPRVILLQFLLQSSEQFGYCSPLDYLDAVSDLNAPEANRRVHELSNWVQNISTPF